MGHQAHNRKTANLMRWAVHRVLPAAERFAHVVVHRTATQGKPAATKLATGVNLRVLLRRARRYLALRAARRNAPHHFRRATTSWLAPDLPPSGPESVRSTQRTTGINVTQVKPHLCITIGNELFKPITQKWHHIRDWRRIICGIVLLSHMFQKHLHRLFPFYPYHLSEHNHFLNIQHRFDLITWPMPHRIYSLLVLMDHLICPLIVPLHQFHNVYHLTTVVRPPSKNGKKYPPRKQRVRIARQSRRKEDPAR